MSRKYRRGKKRKRRRENDVFLMGIVIVMFTAFLLEYNSENLLKSLIEGAILILLVFIIYAGVQKVYIRIKKKRVFDNLVSLEQMKRMDPYEFEEFVALLFASEGYESQITQKSGDHGIDTFLFKKGMRYAIQSKRYKHNVSPKEVRDFLGSITALGIKKGFFVTTSSFSKQTKEWVSKNKVPIELIDGPALLKRVHRMRGGRG